MINTGDRFVIKQQLGEGSFSKIYQAHDKKLKSDVALKVEKEDKHKRILKFEYEILKNLQGLPHIPKIFEFIDNNLGMENSSTQNSNFISMELLGKNVASYKKSHNSFDNIKAYDILLQMLEAIEHIHDRGYIHRDIKPTNFVTSLKHPNDNVKVFMVDFGLAKNHLDRNLKPIPPRTNTDFRGTLTYASLNAHYKRELSRRDDMWSFFFVILDLTNETLPWRQCKDDKDDIKKVKEICLHDPEKKLFLGTSKGKKEISEILTHLKTLKYEDRPNYYFIKMKINELRFAELKKLNGIFLDIPSIKELYHSFNNTNVMGTNINNSTNMSNVNNITNLNQMNSLGNINNLNNITNSLNNLNSLPGINNLSNSLNSIKQNYFNANTYPYNLFSQLASNMNSQMSINIPDFSNLNGYNNNFGFNNNFMNTGLNNLNHPLFNNLGLSNFSNDNFTNANILNPNLGLQNNFMNSSNNDYMEYARNFYLNLEKFIASYSQQIQLPENNMPFFTDFSNNNNNNNNCSIPNLNLNTMNIPLLNTLTNNLNNLTKKKRKREESDEGIHTKSNVSPAEDSPLSNNLTNQMPTTQAAPTNINTNQQNQIFIINQFNKNNLTELENKLLDYLLKNKENKALKTPTNDYNINSDDRLLINSIKKNLNKKVNQVEELDLNLSQDLNNLSNFLIKNIDNLDNLVKEDNLKTNVNQNLNNDQITANKTFNNKTKNEKTANFNMKDSNLKKKRCIHRKKRHF